jgi:hypothetical protein
MSALQRLVFKPTGWVAAFDATKEQIEDLGKVLTDHHAKTKENVLKAAAEGDAKARTTLAKWLRSVGLTPAWLLPVDGESSPKSSPKSKPAPASKAAPKTKAPKSKAPKSKAAPASKAAPKSKAPASAPKSSKPRGTRKHVPPSSERGAEAAKATPAVKVPAPKPAKPAKKTAKPAKKTAKKAGGGGGGTAKKTTAKKAATPKKVAAKKAPTSKATPSKAAAPKKAATAKLEKATAKKAAAPKPKSAAPKKATAKKAPTSKATPKRAAKAAAPKKTAKKSKAPSAKKALMAQITKARKGLRDALEAVGVQCAKSEGKNAKDLASAYADLKVAQAAQSRSPEVKASHDRLKAALDKLPNRKAVRKAKATAAKSPEVKQAALAVVAGTLGLKGPAEAQAAIDAVEGDPEYVEALAAYEKAKQGGDVGKALANLIATRSRCAARKQQVRDKHEPKIDELVNRYKALGDTNAAPPTVLAGSAGRSP